MTEAKSPELERALRARYGEGRFKVHADGTIEVLGANGKWRKVARVGGRLPGRPRDMTKGRKVTVYLDTDTYDIIARIGNGNLSLGIRRAVKMASL